MLKRIVILMVAAFCVMPAVQAQGKFGAGAVFGEPTGIAWKYRISRVNAVDGEIGFSPYDAYRFDVDYLWEAHPFNAANLSLHYGPGVAFGFGQTRYVVYYSRNGYFLRDAELGFGVRGLIGITYLIRNSPVDLFLEAAPLLVLTPSGGSGVDVGFGARVYF